MLSLQIGFKWRGARGFVDPDGPHTHTIRSPKGSLNQALIPPPTRTCTHMMIPPLFPIDFQWEKPNEREGLTLAFKQFRPRGKKIRRGPGAASLAFAKFNRKIQEEALGVKF